MATNNQIAAEAMAVETPVVQTKKYYPYAAVTLANGSSFLAYTGTPIEQAMTDEAPANASVWQPRVGDSPGIRSYFDGFGWADGPDVATMTLAQLQSLSLNKANSEFEASIDAIGAGYPSGERSSWQQQLADAQTVLNGGAASALLTALATARTIDVKELASKIVAKNEAYTVAYSTALASFQKLRANIQDATEISQLPPLTLQDIVFNM